MVLTEACRTNDIDPAGLYPGICFADQYMLAYC